MDEIRSLQERAKELRCLYAVDSIVADRAQPPARVFARILEEIPAGWQHPESTGARIEYLGRAHVGPGFDPARELLSEPIVLWGTEVGHVAVSDAQDAGPGFLPEEAELLRRIAGRIGEYLEWKHNELLGEPASARRNHWAWRQRFAEALADSLDADRFGVEAMFLGGSTARGDAGPGSDLDLYIVPSGTDEQRRDLAMWLEGWSHCLGEVALQQTGYPFPDGMLNVEWLDRVPDAHRAAELQPLRLRRGRTQS